MKRAFFAFLIVVTIFVSRGYSQMVAEQITKDNAGTRLFSGSDANGGVGDWYLSNGIVEAIVDNAALSPDTRLPIQNALSPTGGTLIDLALVGKNNDQFNQVFQVANINPNNAFFYTSVKAESSPQLATVTSQGLLLFGDISGTSKPTLRVSTVYSLAPGDRFITITSTILNTNKSDVPVFNITDAFIWTIHGLVPFAPFPGRGFNNPQLRLTAQGIADALGLFPFVVAPGNLGPNDGMMDTVNGASCGEVSYGIVPVSIAIDPDGPDGPLPPNIVPISMLLGANSNLVSGLGNPFDPAKSPPIPAGGSFTYTRRIFLGDRNDVASVADTLYKNLPNPSASPLPQFGTLVGDLDGDDNPNVQASILFEGKIPFLFGDKSLPISQILTDSTGKFSLVLPPGEYTLTIISPERNDMTGVKVTVTPGSTTTASLPKMSAVGTVAYSVTEKGNLTPSKLTFIGVEGTTNPDFSRYLDSFLFDPKTGKTVENVGVNGFKGSPLVNFLFTTDGVGKQTIKPGKYLVIASRGNEYTIDMKTVTVSSGQESKLDFKLERVIDTTGFVSADFHVHSGKSLDASVPLEDRVRSYVAEGVEVIVSTDHNYITDFAPVLQKLGLNRFAKTIIGEEITTSLPNPIFTDGFGHHNVFPVLVDPIAPRHGAVNTEYVNAATFYDRAKLNNPGVREVIQLNHARAGLFGTGSLTTGGIFNTVIKFNPTKPLPFGFFVTSSLNTGTRNIDFDAMEIYNGENIGFYQTLRNDWFSFINQGFFKTATAVTDSHRLVVDAPGFPRSYIGSPTDEPSSVTDDMVTKSVLAGNVLGTSGPFIRFSIDGKGMGSLISKKTGKVTASITVTAPAWVPVDEVRIYANGKLVKSFDATTNPKVVAAPGDPTSNQGVERFKATVKLKPLSGKDTYFTVEAGTKLPKAIDTDGDGVIDRGDTNGDGKIDNNDSQFVQPPSPIIYQMIAPGYVPLAFTNPIFIDRNGNGKFDAPGVDPSIVETTILETKPQKEIEYRKENGEIDNAPWFKIVVGPEEMEKFFDKLTEAERTFALPLIKKAD